MRDAVAAAGAGDARGELGKLQLDAARLRARVDVREHVQRDRADRERSGVEQRPFAARDADADAVHGHPGCEREVARARAGAQHVDDDAVGQRRAAAADGSSARRPRARA